MPDFRMRIRQTGGPEAIERETITPTEPGTGEARVRQTAIGLNFIDIYQRSGLYPLDLPSGMGSEAAGVVEAIGEGVEGIAVGDRVAYAGGPPGAYATVRTLDAGLLVPLPDAISDETAAAAMLKGGTAAYLIGPCARVEKGQPVLVHAAAGGVGSILVQWLGAIGATVIAHAGSPEKAEHARTLGAAHSLACPMDQLADTVRRLTDGAGVATVFDGIGKASWDASLGSVARRGLIVSYGNASGAVPPFEMLALMRAGSIFVTRPTMADYAGTPAERRALAARLFERIAAGDVSIRIGQRFSLAQASEAQRAMAARETTGSTVLLP
jgi:NADPH2:quinone reductase